VTWVFYRNFDRIEAPFLELGEELGALGGERRRVKEGVKADSHGMVGWG
jgi:hypothetical protein